MLLKTFSKSDIKKSTSGCEGNRQQHSQVRQRARRKSIQYKISNRKLKKRTTLGRCQFSEEKAKTVRTWIPHLQESLTNPCRALQPAACPAAAGIPFEAAHRTFPSIITATCFGNASRRSPNGSNSLSSLPSPSPSSLRIAIGVVSVAETVVMRMPDPPTIDGGGEATRIGAGLVMGFSKLGSKKWVLNC